MYPRYEYANGPARARSKCVAGDESSPHLTLITAPGSPSPHPPCFSAAGPILRAFFCAVSAS